MNSFVIDASVGIKWFIPELHEQAALALYRGEYTLMAPDLIYSEVGNILCKKWRRGEISEKVARGILLDFRDIDFLICQSRDLMDVTLDIAVAHNLSFYDSLYVAAAVHADSALVTADNKLYTSLAQTVLSRHVLWIEDIPLNA